jgi:ribonucleoside-diphosphate reductase alpha chain
MAASYFTEPIAEHVWQVRYRLSEDGHSREPDIQHTWERVALALSAPELHHRAIWRQRFSAILADGRFLPGGRILASAGTARRQTLFNCFVSGTIHDSLDSIFSLLGETMITMQEGGGVGCDFSLLRPAGMRAASTGNTASGPVSFMQIWDQACRTLASHAARGGAMMATLRCDHPDIEAFVDAKRERGALQCFNLSVLATDAFMRAVEQDEPWPLVFPLDGRRAPEGAMVCDRVWSGAIEPVPCAALKTVSARALWQRIQRAAFDVGDPGVIFIDRVDRANNLWYTETLSATNPCGEVPLPPHGVCNLGSINLTQFVRDPFGAHARMDLLDVGATAAVAVRMLDNVYEVSKFPLRSQDKAAHRSRRIGIGLTGLADAFAMLGLRYGSDSALDLAEAVMRTICQAAYRASIELAQERGSFPDYRPDKFLLSGFAQSLPGELAESIRRHGLRNSHLTAIAPAGSISLLANNVSSGIEPVFAFQSRRRVRTADGKAITIGADDYAWALYRRLHGTDAKLPPAFVEAQDIDPAEQLELQARLQAHVDQSISKTIMVPLDAGFDQYSELFLQAYRLGLKGCTMFRAADPAAVIGAAGRCAVTPKP